MAAEQLNAFKEPFNSLSRDHINKFINYIELRSLILSTPSLGITDLIRREGHWLAETFNSLSRDHKVPRAPTVAGADPFNSLSRDHQIPEGALFWHEVPKLSTPSLGITARSGPDPAGTPFGHFQLPLSGSPRVRGISFGPDFVIFLSTPSLGITSLDLQLQVIRAVLVRLSTPSLGITIPKG